MLEAYERMLKTVNNDIDAKYIKSQILKLKQK